MDLQHRVAELDDDYDPLIPGHIFDSEDNKRIWKVMEGHELFLRIASMDGELEIDEEKIPADAWHEGGRQRIWKLMEAQGFHRASETAQAPQENNVS